MSKKIHSGYCKFAKQRTCDKEHNCMDGDFCDAFEQSIHITPQVKGLKIPLSPVEQFEKVMGFDDHG